jgi:putative acetyltransferase
VIIRSETAADIETIAEVTRAAFAAVPISHQTEHFIVSALRQANALTISLVAEAEGQIVGHIAFSPLTITDGSPDWYGLGPISVLPACQRQGIGKALMHEGLSRLQALGANGCVLVGDPNYYERFGFKSLPELTHEGVPQEYVLSLLFGDNRAQGQVTFHESFAATK